MSFNKKAQAERLEHGVTVEKLSVYASRMQVDVTQTTLSEKDCRELGLPLPPSGSMSALKWHDWLDTVEAVIKIRKAKALIQALEKYL